MRRASALGQPFEPALVSLALAKCVEVHTPEKYLGFPCRGPCLYLRRHGQLCLQMMLAGYCLLDSLLELAVLS